MSAFDPKRTLAALFYVRPFFWWVLDFRHVSSWADRKYPPQASPAVCGLAPWLRHLWAAWSTACGAARLCHGGFFAGRHCCDRNVRSWQCLSARNVFGFFSAQYLDQLFDRTSVRSRWHEGGGYYRTLFDDTGSRRRSTATQAYRLPGVV